MFVLYHKCPKRQHPTGCRRRRYNAALEIRSRLVEMKKKREYVSELYLASSEEAGKIISLQEWHDKAPPKASWDK